MESAFKYTIGTTVSFTYLDKPEIGTITRCYKATNVNGRILPVRYSIETPGSIYFGIDESDITPLR